MAPFNFLGFNITPLQWEFEQLMGAKKQNAIFVSCAATNELPMSWTQFHIYGYISSSSENWELSYFKTHYTTTGHMSKDALHPTQGHLINYVLADSFIIGINWKEAKSS